MHVYLTPGRARRLQSITKGCSYAAALIIPVHIEPIQISMGHIHIGKSYKLSVVKCDQSQMPVKLAAPIL